MCPFGARGGSRTRTPLRALAPEASEQRVYQFHHSRKWLTASAAKVILPRKHPVVNTLSPFFLWGNTGRITEKPALLRAQGSAAAPRTRAPALAGAFVLGRMTGLENGRLSFPPFLCAIYPLLLLVFSWFLSAFLSPLGMASDQNNDQTTTRKAAKNRGSLPGFLL